MSSDSFAAGFDDGGGFVFALWCGLETDLDAEHLIQFDVRFRFVEHFRLAGSDVQLLATRSAASAPCSLCSLCSHSVAFASRSSLLTMPSSSVLNRRHLCQAILDPSRVWDSQPSTSVSGRSLPLTSS